MADFVFKLYLKFRSWRQNVSVSALVFCTPVLIFHFDIFLRSVFSFNCFFCHVWTFLLSIKRRLFLHVKTLFLNIFCENTKFGQFMIKIKLQGRLNVMPPEDIEPLATPFLISELSSCVCDVWPDAPRRRTFDVLP